jgi:hypothetical protein
MKTNLLSMPAKKYFELGLILSVLFISSRESDAQKGPGTRIEYTVSMENH